MPQTKRKNLRRTKIRKRKYTKKGGAPKKLNNNVNKLIRDEGMKKGDIFLMP